MAEFDDVFKFGKSDWRSNTAIILEAELLASPAWRVADYLRERAEELGSTYDDEADENLELALLERSDPLIEISLALVSADEKRANLAAGPKEGTVRLCPWLWG